MPKKLDVDKTYGQKLLALFAKLLFTGKPYYMTELAEELGCSKQTVLRLVRDISTNLNVPLQEFEVGRRRYVEIPKSKPMHLPLTVWEVELLQMCRMFTAHLLGSKLFDEAAHALLKSEAGLKPDEAGDRRAFGSYRPGTIDYTPFQDTMRLIIQALDQRQILKIHYRAIEGKGTKVFQVKPLKLFSHHDTVYLHAEWLRPRGLPREHEEYKPLLAVHRFEKAEITPKKYEFPADYDFEKEFNRHFGVIKGEPFKVEVEMWGWAARFAAERIWSPDQQVDRLEGDRIRLAFTTSSEPELFSWLLAFGDEARLLAPARLVKEAKALINRIRALYQT